MNINTSAKILAYKKCPKLNELVLNMKFMWLVIIKITLCRVQHSYSLPNKNYSQSNRFHVHKLTWGNTSWIFFPNTFKLSFV